MLSPRVPDLTSLELLLAVDETGSFGQAALRHGVTQPAVSARLARMERQVGVRLLDRGPRGARVTREGALLVVWAREVLAAAGALDAGIASLRADHGTRLRVAASLTVAEYLLPQWLVRLAAEHPETAVSLEPVNSAEVLRRVRDARVDLGFVEGPDVPEGVDSTVVAHDELRVVVAPSHPWRRRRARPLTAVELARVRLVQREPHSGTRTALEGALRTALTAAGEDVDLAPPLLELASTSAVRSAALTGAGPAVLSALAVADDVRGGRLVALPVAGVDLRRALRAVWPRGVLPAGPARDLLGIAGRAGETG
ncbi:LysR family transcriptional regulator [Kineococcus gynurae]|uniref:LysR family transcriptional regulator n=1 Tax=Kineococcus gynurae TaxID=452979 RepID=A0ABV5LQG8_9ACTN